MSNPLDNILNYIPQRPPFVFVDKLLLSNETITRSEFLVKDDNLFVENGYLNESGLIENIAQTAASRAGYISVMENKPILVGYIAAINNLNIYFFPQIGDKLDTEVITENQIFNVTLISGKISCNEKKVAQCEMKIFINEFKNT